MLSLFQIEERLQQHAEYFKKVEQFIQSNDIELTYPIYLKATNEIAEKLSNLLKGLMAVGKESNLYCCYVIYRTLLEHFYKSFFLMVNLVDDTSEKASEHYDTHYFISEFLAEELGYLDLEDLQNEAEKRTDFVQYIQNKFETLKEFDKANQRELSEAIKKFNLKEIVKTLHKKFSENKESKWIADFFAEVLPEYSQLSTYIHGGPYGTKLIRKFDNSDKLESEILRVAGVGFSCFGVAKENLLFAYALSNQELTQFQVEFQKIRNPIPY